MVFQYHTLMDSVSLCKLQMLCKPHMLCNPVTWSVRLPSEDAFASLGAAWRHSIEILSQAKQLLSAAWSRWHMYITDIVDWGWSRWQTNLYRRYVEGARSRILALVWMTLKCFYASGGLANVYNYSWCKRQQRMCSKTCCTLRMEPKTLFLSCSIYIWYVDSCKIIGLS